MCILPKKSFENFLKEKRKEVVKLRSESRSSDDSACFQTLGYASPAGNGTHVP